MKDIKFVISLVALSAGTPALSAEFIISPFAPQNLGGSAAPFFTLSEQAASVRYQQVYGASDFLRHGGPQYLITEISFAGGGVGFPPPPGTLSNVQITFSTTPRQPDGLSALFSENVGPHETTVFSGSLRFIFTSETYGAQLLLQEPFLYDPAMGNLLMDVRNFQTLPPPDPPTGLWGLLTAETIGDTVSRAWALDVNTPVATFLDTPGLSTRFTVTPIPEPNAAALLVLGAIVVALVRGRRQQPGKGKTQESEDSCH